MHYWIITTEYPPAYGGGISTYCYHSAKMMSKAGIQVKIFVPNCNITHPIKHEIIDDIEVILFKPEGKEYYNYLGYNAALSYHFYDLINDEINSNGKPDFIESQDYNGIAYYLLLNKKIGNENLKNIPIVVTAHAPSYFYWENNQFPLYKLPEYWIGEMEKWTIKAADILISPSQFLMDKISDNVKLRFNGYNIVRNPYSIEIENNNEDFIHGDIVFFGKLVYQKGCKQLLDFMSQLWDDDFPYALSIVGGDAHFDLKNMSMKDYLIKKYKKYYEKNLIKFEGKLDFLQIKKRLTKAHVVIVPSVVDNFPYTVVEGMSMKKVMLVSNQGGQKEMIEDGISGFVYDFNEFASFKEKLLLIIDSSAETINKIGKDARKRIELLCNYNSVLSSKLNVLELYKTNNNSKIFPFIREIEKTKYLYEINYESDLLSIVVPYYNTGKYILETITTLSKINYSNKEIIIINDGSDEPESIEVLNKINDKFNVKIITQKNAGLSSARNRGLNEAKGEYIAFLDADDLIHNEFYSKSIELLKQYTNVSFVSSWVKYFDSDSGIWPSQIPEPPYMLIHNMINAGFVCRKIDYLNFGKNDTSFEYGMEDYDSNISLLKNGCRGIVIPEPLYYYRIHPASMARQFNKANQLYLYKLLSNKHSDFFAKYSFEIYNLLQSNGPSYLFDNPTFESTDVISLKAWNKELQNENNWYKTTLEKYKSQEKFKANDEHVNISDTYLQNENNPNDKTFIESNNNNSNAYNELNQLKQWYFKEYEVLPLWYKRFGHLIKAFMGNRSFKSFFNKK